MISGKKNEIHKLLPYLSENLQLGLKYILETDFSNMENGTYEIKGKDVFAIVNTYDTEAAEAKKPERHVEYIDIQYLNKGSEIIYYDEDIKNLKLVEDYAEERDLLFYEDFSEQNQVVLGQKVFAIFFPWEYHRPGCKIGENKESVQKIVVKVRK